MIHKHHANCHAVGFLAGVLLLGGVLGGVSAVVGGTVISGVQALREGDLLSERETVILRSTERRRARKDQRVQQREGLRPAVPRTYPTETNSLVLGNQSRDMEVALGVASFSYPALGISAPVGKPSLTHWEQRNWRALEEQMQFGLLHGLVVYPHSPHPGGAGTINVAGHSSAPTLSVLGSPYEDVFAELPDARIGDRVEIRDDEGQTHVYEVYDTAVIPPTQTSILLQDTAKREVVLMTCYPVGTTKDRFIARAKLVEGGKNMAARSVLR